MYDMNTVYTITLADGTQLKNIRCNGNMFISDQQIKESAFKNNCSPVVISDEETEERHEHMVLGRLDHPDDGTSVFYLRDLTDEEIYRLKVSSDIEYLAMMSDIEL